MFSGEQSRFAVSKSVIDTCNNTNQTKSIRIVKVYPYFLNAHLYLA